MASLEERRDDLVTQYVADVEAQLPLPTIEDIVQAQHLCLSYLSTAAHDLDWARQLPSIEAFEPRRTKAQLINHIISLASKHHAALLAIYDTIKEHKMPEPLRVKCNQCSEMIPEPNYREHVQYHLKISMEELGDVSRRAGKEE